MIYEQINRPTYVLEEQKLRNNLSLIKSVAKEADVEIILAFKAYALWRTFPIFREYIGATTASSLHEARLASSATLESFTFTMTPSPTRLRTDSLVPTAA